MKLRGLLLLLFFLLGWFKDLSSLFLSCPAAKLLIIAGTCDARGKLRVVYLFRYLTELTIRRRNLKTEVSL